ncbi:MAG: glycosyltransferase [Spirochaetaceae bacterium]|nr:glycosyltransferase [Spirochaetaceae bacterium]
MISVCTPTYNGSLFLKDQLDSILCQLTADDELIISDDSSTDDTTQIIECYNDSRIKLLKDNSFHSPVYNLENALRHSRGDFIFLSDQDDVWLPGKVKIMLEHLQRYDCVVSDAKVVDGECNVIHKSFFELNHSGPGLFRNIVKNGFLGCCMAFNRTILDKVLPFPNPIPMHDTWIGLVAEKYGTTFFLNEPLILYRRHGANASPTAEKSRYSITEKIYHRYLFAKNIIQR